MFPSRAKQDTSFMNNMMGKSNTDHARDGNRMLSDELDWYDIKQIASEYLMFTAMYELKDDMSYTALDTNLNKDLMTWKS